MGTNGWLTGAMMPSPMEISTVTYFPRHTKITVRFRHQLYSSQVPELANNLLTMIPSLRNHLCENRNGLRFEEEVRDTELGHVFEHVVLALLHARGYHLRGHTTWNWHREPLGTYQVTINTGKKLLIKESLLLAQAILTNALIGPVLRFTIPGIEARTDARPLLVESAREPTRLLFSSEPIFLKQSISQSDA